MIADKCELCGEDATGQIEKMPVCHKCYETKPEEVRAKLREWESDNDIG